MALFDALISPALKAVTDLISQFHLSPEEKAQATQAIADASARALLASQQYEVQLNQIASDNIKTEAASGDAYERRARPSFVYLVIAILAFDYIALPLFQVFGSKVAPIELPVPLLELFGAVVLGYVGARSIDKATALPGDSQVSILGIVKVANKS